MCMVNLQKSDWPTWSKFSIGWALARYRGCAVTLSDVSTNVSPCVSNGRMQLFCTCFNMWWTSMCCTRNLDVCCNDRLLEKKRLPSVLIWCTCLSDQTMLINAMLLSNNTVFSLHVHIRNVAKISLDEWDNHTISQSKVWRRALVQNTVDSKCVLSFHVATIHVTCMYWIYNLIFPFSARITNDHMCFVQVPRRKCSYSCHSQS